ncbi:hypothetical protein J4Q44_G00217600, partial [Coregonus suidteri]
FSKFAHFLALPKLPTARETADILVEHVFRSHGLPTDIVSDRGPQFVSQVCKALGITSSLSSGYHPQTNGQAERANQEMETTLRCVTGSNPGSWSSMLPWVEYAHNTLTNASSGLSPFLCDLGYQPPLFPSQERELAVPSVQSHMRRCFKVWRKARVALSRASSYMQRQANRPRLPVTLLVKRFIPLFMCPRSSLCLSALCARPLVPLLRPGLWVGVLSTLSGDFWMFAAGVVVSSTWWIGRVMVLRNVPGFPGASLWILLWSVIFIGYIRINSVGRRVASVEGGGTVRPTAAR